LGNFSISHYTAIHLESDAVVLRYVIDMAEIPAFQEIQETKIVPQAGHPSLPAYLTQRVEALRAGLLLELNGQPLRLNAEAREVIFPAGAGGLPTLKIRVFWRAQLDGGAGAAVQELRYRDTNFPGRAGWKEIIATGGQGVVLVSSTVPERDRSHELADYPTDLLNSQPQDVEARVVLARQARTPEVAAVGTPLSGTPEMVQNHRSTSPLVGEDRGEGKIAPGELQPHIEPVRLEVNRQLTPRSSFTELVTTQQLGFGIVLVTMAISADTGCILDGGFGGTAVRPQPPSHYPMPL
jgi:hypothetical protein